MLTIVANVVPSTTDRMVGIFGPITCSGYACVAEVLQYTVYAVMMPFLGMGGVQTMKSWFGEPEIDPSTTLCGGEGTTDKYILISYVAFLFL